MSAQPSRWPNAVGKRSIGSARVSSAKNGAAAVLAVLREFGEVEEELDG
jgi:hypothetical protein